MLAAICLFHPSLQVLDLISSDSLNVPSEEEVYRAVLSWVKHDVDSRRQHVPRVRDSAGFKPAPSLCQGGNVGLGAGGLCSPMARVIGWAHPADAPSPFS